MKNFIFKSNSKSDLDKIFSYLRVMGMEMRAQRSDLRKIKRLLKVDTPEISKEISAEELGFDISKDTE